MSKKLKIQFWKAEKSLAMQILEQEGLPKSRETGFIRIAASPSMELAEVRLRGYFSDDDYKISSITFNSNSMRDIYLKNTIDSITNALFSHGKEELNSGEMCEVWDMDLKIGEVCAISNDPQFLDCYTGKLIAILPKGFKNRYIIESVWDTNGWVCGEYARMFNRIERPTVEECGNVVTYTWEEK